MDNSSPLLISNKISTCSKNVSGSSRCGDVDLKQGRITIDAKSLLGICSMNIEEEMELQVFNGDAEELKELIKKFLV